MEVKSSMRENLFHRSAVVPIMALRFCRERLSQSTLKSYRTLEMAADSTAWIITLWPTVMTSSLVVESTLRALVFINFGLYGPKSLSVFLENNQVSLKDWCELKLFNIRRNGCSPILWTNSAILGISTSYQTPSWKLVPSYKLESSRLIYKQLIAGIRTSPFFCWAWVLRRSFRSILFKFGALELDLLHFWAQTSSKPRLVLAQFRLNWKRRSHVIGFKNARAGKDPRFSLALEGDWNDVPTLSGSKLSEHHLKEGELSLNCSVEDFSK